LLALKYFELVAEIQPRAFIFENVPGLLTVNGGSDWFHLLDHARRVTGYQVHFKRINAVTFGIPQLRERLVLVGFKESVDFSFPVEPTGPGADALVRMEASPSRWALEAVDGLPNHRIREHGDRVRRRYENTPQGSRDRTDHTDRLHPDRPSGTVLVGSSAGGGRPHIHPFEPRVITVREGARLQSFPDWYRFAGPITNQYRQIGNAVPPLLAYEVGVAIQDALNRR
jgi:DNA (cytosine-5)-methyltransferase 1